MKKLCFFLIFSFFLALNSVSVFAKTTPPAVSADSVVLMDAQTGDIIYSKNMDTAYPPASTTKIMTALLTLEKCNLDDTVTIGKKPPLADGSKIYIFEGEELKVRDLLYGLLLASANDCAEALAEHISGSVENFAIEMNNKAKALGCSNTNFVNPSGLYNEKHKTSARDLALIMREISNNSEYTKIATTASYKIPKTNKSSTERPLWNENKLVQKGSYFFYEGCEGGKTGYTVQSEHSYVATATKNNQKLIVALIHDKQKTFFYDSRYLFDYGFNNYQLVKLFNKGDKVSSIEINNKQIPLLASTDFYYVKEKETTISPDIKLMEKEPNSKYFKLGDVIMSASINFGDKALGTLKLSSGVDYKMVEANIKSIGLNVQYVFIFLGIIFILALFFVFRIVKKRKNSCI